LQGENTRARAMQEKAKQQDAQMKRQLGEMK
jgi:hypothetical protein